MRRLLLFGLVICVGCTGGASDGLPDVGAKVPATAQDVLANAESTTLYALDPYPMDDESHPPGAVRLHGYTIIGRLELDPGQQRTALQAIYEGIAEKKDTTVAACFNPRHGLTAVRGDQRVDLVICYECLSLKVHGPGAGDYQSVLTRQFPGPRLTELLASAGIEIHED